MLSSGRLSQGQKLASVAIPATVGHIVSKNRLFLPDFVHPRFACAIYFFRNRQLHVTERKAGCVSLRSAKFLHRVNQYRGLGKLPIDLNFFSVWQPW